MARPHSKRVYLYRPALSAQWWIRYTLPPDVARHYTDPAGVVPGGRPDKQNRISRSLHTTDKRTAEDLSRRLQLQLDKAWLKTLDHETFAVLTNDEGKTTRTLEHFFQELAADEQRRVALHRELHTPRERRDRKALAPETAKHHALKRRYLTEALTALYPGKHFYLHQFRCSARGEPDVAKIRDWIIQERRLDPQTWDALRAYFKGAWFAAQAAGYADQNPWANRQLLVARADAPARAVLTPAHVNQLLALPSGFANNALKLMICSSSRPSDLCWWQWSGFDAANNQWAVMQSKVAKTKLVPHTPTVAGIVRDQRKVLDDLGLGDSLWLFPRTQDGKLGQPRGGQSERKAMDKMLNRALHGALGKKDALGRPISVYTIRRTFATVGGRRAKQDPHNIASLMGHSNVEQQLTYSQIDAAALAQTSDAILAEMRGQPATAPEIATIRVKRQGRR